MLKNFRKGEVVIKQEKEWVPDDDDDMKEASLFEEEHTSKWQP